MTRNKFTREKRLKDIETHYTNKFYMCLGSAQAYKNLGFNAFFDKEMEMANIFLDKAKKVMKSLYQVEVYE